MDRYRCIGMEGFGLLNILFGIPFGYTGAFLFLWRFFLFFSNNDFLAVYYSPQEIFAWQRREIPCFYEALRTTLLTIIISLYH